MGARGGETSRLLGEATLACADLSVAFAAFLARMSARICSFDRFVATLVGEDWMGRESGVSGDMVGGEAVIGPSAKEDARCGSWT